MSTPTKVGEAGTPAADDFCSARRTAVVEPVRARRHGVIEEGKRTKIAADDPCDLSPQGRQGHELSTAHAMRVRTSAKSGRNREAGRVAMAPPNRARPASGVSCPAGFPSHQCPAVSVRLRATGPSRARIQGLGPEAVLQPSGRLASRPPEPGLYSTGGVPYGKKLGADGVHLKTIPKLVPDLAHPLRLHRSGNG